MADHQQRVKALFNSIVELDSADARSAYLDAQCRNDPQLRAEVMELIAHDGQLDDFLAEPAAVLDTELLPQPKSVGTQIGPYKIREQIGEGGMGLVFVAEQEQPIRRKVALKLIKPGMDSKEVIARFEAERQALALMDHSHIAKVHDAGTTETGRPYFVMELVRGLPLTEYCDQVNLSLGERLQLFITVCRAIQHAHHKGIIHRDLKPSNVMITLHDGKPVPKVIDFGVAKALNQKLTEKTLYTRHAQMLGTPMYMSPEQAELSGLDVDTRSDVYSLGVLLYELLTGHTPFDQDALAQLGYDDLRRMVREVEPPRPSARVTTLPGANRSTVATQRGMDQRHHSRTLKGELDWIVMKALEKDRARRYGSADALATDVQRYLEDQPVQACPPSWTYRFGKLARRNKRILTTAILVFLSLAVGLVASVVQARRAVDSEREAELASEEFRELLYASDMMLASRDWRQDDVEQARDRLARHIPADGERDLRGLEWHYLWNQGNVPGRLIASLDEAIYDIAISPNGELYAVVGADADIRVFDVATDSLKFTTPTHQGEVNGVAFSPDSNRIATAGDNGTIRVWDAGTHELLLDIQAHDGLAYQVVFSPAGDVLASCGDDFTVFLWNADTGAALGTLNEHELSVETIAVSNDGVIAAGDEEARMTLWDLADRRPILVPEEHDADPVSSISFSERGYVAHGTVGGRLMIAESRNRTVTYRRKLSSGIQSLAFAPSGRWLVVGDRAGHLSTIPFDVGTWSLSASRQWPAHDGRVYAVAITPDDQRIITGGADGKLMSWEPFGGSSLRHIRLDRRCKTKMAVMDRWRIALVDDDHVLILDPSGEIASYDPSARPGSWCIDYVTGSDLLVMESAQEVVGWNADTNDTVFRWNATPAESFREASTSPNGRVVVLHVFIDGAIEVQIRAVPSGTVITRFSARSAKSLDISPDSRWLAFDSNNAIVLYDLQTQQVVSEWDAHHGSIRELQFHPGGTQLASVSADRTLKLWSLPSGELLQSAVAHRTDATVLEISPDGRRIATSGEDCVLRLWDGQSAQLLWEVPLQFGRPIDLAFSEDSQQLLCLASVHDLLIFDGSPVSGDSPHKPATQEN